MNALTEGKASCKIKTIPAFLLAKWQSKKEVRCPYFEVFFDYPI